MNFDIYKRSYSSFEEYVILEAVLSKLEISIMFKVDKSLKKPAILHVSIKYHLFRILYICRQSVSLFNGSAFQNFIIQNFFLTRVTYICTYM